MHSGEHQLDAQRLLEISSPGHPLRLIFDLAPNGIMLMGPDGTVALVNRQAAAMFGYQPEELVGQSIDLLVPEKFRAKHPAHRDAFLNHPSARPMGAGRDLHGCRKDGTEFPVEVGLTPIPTANGTYILSSIVDITERKATERTLVDAARLKSEFLATMSHELRTPMNVIIGMSTVLAETELSPEQRRYAHMIATGAESLLAIVNDVLDFSKIEAGKLQILSVEFDLNGVAEEAATFLAESAARKGLDLTCRTDPDAPLVLGDPGRIRQILVNIIGNAIKFTEAGEVSVSVSCPPAQDGALTARLEVRDTGIGMSDAIRASLFRPFSQGDASNTRKYGGTGLGLAISKHLVELMGGAVHVESQVGKGSTFWFTIPLGRAKNERPDHVNGLQGKRVLVVDDSETSRACVTQMLSSWKIQCAETGSAAEALQLMRKAGGDGAPFHSVITDQELPGISGLDLVRIVRADPGLAKTPFMLVVKSRRHFSKEARELGVEQQIAKPVQAARMREALEATLRQSQVEDRVNHAAAGALDASTAPPLLVVDDNAGNCTVAQTILGKLGYECEIAVSGKEAVERVKSKTYPLILMDVQMPEMNGLEATAAIRNLEKGVRHTPIVAMTANALVGDRERYLAAGMDDYLSKPFWPREMASVVERWLAAAGAE